MISYKNIDFIRAFHDVPTGVLNIIDTSASHLSGTVEEKRQKFVFELLENVFKKSDYASFYKLAWELDNRNLTSEGITISPFLWVVLIYGQGNLNLLGSSTFFESAGTYNTMFISPASSYYFNVKWDDIASMFYVYSKFLGTGIQGYEDEYVQGLNSDDNPLLEFRLFRFPSKENKDIIAYILKHLDSLLEFKNILTIDKGYHDDLIIVYCYCRLRGIPISPFMILILSYLRHDVDYLSPKSAVRVLESRLKGVNRIFCLESSETLETGIKNFYKVFNLNTSHGWTSLFNTLKNIAELDLKPQFNSLKRDWKELHDMENYSIPPNDVDKYYDIFLYHYKFFQDSSIEEI